MGGNNSKGVDKQKKIKEYVDHIEKEGHDKEESCGDETARSDVDDVDIGRAASKASPEDLRNLLVRANSYVSDVEMAVLQTNPAELQYPFENIIMEGGGNKGLAYVGAIKCLEDLKIMDQIKRIGGTSAGAITAALLALGYTSEETLGFLSQDLESVFLDHSCGYFSLLPNLVRKFGWNPGKKIYNWFGQAIARKMGSPDTTFYELYESTGMELCVVVTNLNLMTAQYCHAKTTPNMPLRDALRMTMAIPGVFAAVEYENHGQNDVYVDGGVLANYPINCYDGWYLSMKREDAFLLKLKQLSDLPTLMASQNRFKPIGPNKTIGLLLFADSEREIMKFSLECRLGAVEPKKPKIETKLWKEKEDNKRKMEEHERSHRKIVRAVESLLAVLHKHNVDSDSGTISRDELRAALQDEEFTASNRAQLFGKDCDLQKAFSILDKDGNNKISFNELLNFIEERGVRMQTRFQGFSRRKVDSLSNFLNALQSTLLTNLKYTAVKETDEGRTVGINTGHLGTMDYDIEDADREFVVERGYNATMSFLRYYAVNNPDIVKKKDPTVQTVEATAVDAQPSSIHNGRPSSPTSDGVKDTDVLLSEKDTPSL